MDYLSKLILEVVAWLDSYGAAEWNLRTVAVTSGIIHLSIRYGMNSVYDIDWDALVHAVITGIGSLMCTYLSLHTSVAIRGTMEPLGSLLCNGPLTSLHRILPSITLGYAICDIVNGIKRGSKDAISHGFATFATMLLFTELGAGHVMAPILVMEVSTIPLTVMRASFISPKMNVATQAIFILSFFFWRILVSPMLCFHCSWVMYTIDFSDCYPRLLFYITFGFSIFFTVLNFYWADQIVKKVKRKLRGEEKMVNTDR